jgi:hypothetical protein
MMLKTIGHYLKRSLMGLALFSLLSSAEAADILKIKIIKEIPDKQYMVIISENKGRGILDGKFDVILFSELGTHFVLNTPYTAFVGIKTTADFKEDLKKMIHYEICDSGGVVRGYISTPNSASVTIWEELAKGGILLVNVEGIGGGSFGGSGTGGSAGSTGGGGCCGGSN